MGRKGRPTAPELVAWIVENGVRVLAEQLDVPEEQAQPVMREFAYRFCQEFGGSRVSIPMDTLYPLERRDDDMWADFNGNNVPELAAKYGRTQQQVRNILKHKRKQLANKAAKLQVALPGFEAAN